MCALSEQSVCPVRAREWGSDRQDVESLSSEGTGMGGDRQDVEMRTCMFWHAGGTTACALTACCENAKHEHLHSICSHQPSVNPPVAHVGPPAGVRVCSCVQSPGHTCCNKGGLSQTHVLQLATTVACNPMSQRTAKKNENTQVS